MTSNDDIDQLSATVAERNGRVSLSRCGGDAWLRGVGKDGLATLLDWRWVASRWSAERRRAGVPFYIHRVLAAIGDEQQRFGDQRATRAGPHR